MNRIPAKIAERAADLLKSGETIRSVMRVLGIERATVKSIAAQIGVRAKPRPRYIRDRRAYVKDYNAKHPMSHYKRLKRNDKLRAAIALLLARASRPMLKEEIYRAVSPQFHGISLGSIICMLHANAERVFHQMGSYWTYQPCEFWFPVDPRNEKVPERNLARAAWFDKYGLKDPLVESAIETWKEKQAERLIQKRVEVALVARKELEMFATMAEVAKSITKHANDKP